MGMVNSVMAWVVGLIVPILSPISSVNQRLPSGPAVMPYGSAARRGDGELGDDVGRRVDRPDLVAVGLGEPEVAVGPRRDRRRVRCSAVGMVNSVMAWVVGLIVPILLPPYSVNQRLPSGPAVIPSGSAAAVGSGNSVVAWVVGLIVPILSALDSVNQRLPSGPAVIPTGAAAAVGVGKSVMLVALSS